MTGQNDDAEVSWQAVECVLAGVTQTCGGFQNRTITLLARNDLPEPERGEWYPLANLRDLYDDLLTDTGRNIVEQIGVSYPTVVDWPVGVDGVGDALAALDDVYRQLHRGDAGGYTFTRTGAQSGRLVCDTPYPPALERGIVRGLGTQFGSDTGFVAVDERTRDDGTTVFEVEWWGERGSTTTASLAPPSDTEYVAGD